MGVFIIVIGLLQIAGGVFAFVAAKSVIHEILGTLSFGMGILSIAMGVACTHLAAIRTAVEKR